jgi:hypothetical protein
VLAIIFRDRVRVFWFKIKSKFRKEDNKIQPNTTGQYPPRPGFPPLRPQGMPPQRPMQMQQPIRRPMNNIPQRPIRRDATDDVLKKLKDITDKK